MAVKAARVPAVETVPPAPALLVPLVVVATSSALGSIV